MGGARARGLERGARAVRGRRRRPGSARGHRARVLVARRRRRHDRGARARIPPLPRTRRRARRGPRCRSACVGLRPLRRPPGRRARLARPRRPGLLADEEVAPEHAWLAVREAEVALAAGEPAVAREAAARAVSLGGEVGSEEVQVIGRSLDGLALVYEGSIDEGMRQLDESAVAARAGDVKDMAWVGKVCCNLIAACERIGDVERASEWCAEVKEFAQRWELQALFNVCRTQYAAVLLQTGAWQEAEAELQTALAVFHGGRRAALFDGTARLGELRRRQGRLDEARALFAESERSSVSRLGRVALCLDEEDPRRRSRRQTGSLARPSRKGPLIGSRCWHSSSAQASRRSGSMPRQRRPTSSTRLRPRSARRAHARQPRARTARLPRRQATSRRHAVGSRMQSTCSTERPTSVRRRGSRSPASCSSCSKNNARGPRRRRPARPSSRSTPVAMWPPPTVAGSAGRGPAHPPRARGARARRRRPEQPRDRLRARAQRAHGSPARREHPAQAGRADAGGRGRASGT